MHRNDHGTGTEKQQSLEESMSEQVEHADRIGARAHCDEHVAELRTGRIGDDALDVVLHERDRGGEERRGGTDESDESLCAGRQIEQRPEARRHEYAAAHTPTRADLTLS